MTEYSSAVAEHSVVLKPKPGILLGVYVTVGSGSELMIFDATAVPDDGEVAPLDAFAATTQTFPRYREQIPLLFSNGIVLVISSTGPFLKTTPTGPGSFFRATFV